MYGKDCGAKNDIKPREPIRCRECGHRIMYKKRTKRSKSGSPSGGLYCLDSELCNSGAIRGAVDSLLGGSGGPGEAGDEAALILAASTEVTSVLRQRKISLSYLCCLFYISVILVLYPNV